MTAPVPTTSLHRTMKDATRVIRAGQPAPEQGRPLMPGPTFASLYHLSGDPASSEYTYGRFHNPTWDAFEGALEELEGGPAVSFSSGMAAVAAVLGVVLRPGDTLVLQGDGYYAVRVVAGDHLASLGVEVRTAERVDRPLGRLLHGARLLWIETPSNPGLGVCDVAAVAEEAHAAGALLAVDNTTATALLQKPLVLGADLSVASDSKALAGHGDLILGHVSARDPALVGALRTWRTRMGAIPGPMEAWLAHRSIGTLDVRLTRMCANARRVAGMLAGRPDVVGVRYPGLETHPGHDVARRQMSDFGSVVSFDLETEGRAEAFLRACRLVDESTSFGGLHTTAERRARWGGDAVGAGFIRMSVGCEDADDLLGDLSAALDSSRSG